MARLNVLNPETAEDRTAELLRQVGEARGGTIPNIYRVMANSPWVLRGYLAFSRNIGQGKLESSLSDMVHLACAELNGCAYCIAANTAMATKSGSLTAEQALAARKLEGSDERTLSALAFVREVLETRGKVSDDILKRLRDAGSTDEEIIELLAVTVAATFTNFISSVALQDSEFPEPPALA
jgi:AhpD family alkylhydroperoxidase